MKRIIRHQIMNNTTHLSVVLAAALIAPPAFGAEPPSRVASQN